MFLSLSYRYDSVSVTDCFIFRVLAAMHTLDDVCGHFPVPGQSFLPPRAHEFLSACKMCRYVFLSIKARGGTGAGLRTAILTSQRAFSL